MRLLRGKRPANLGARNGRLQPPPRTPKGVSSQADPKADPGHFIAPLSFKGNPKEAWARLVQQLRGLPGVTIVKDAAGYLHAECASRLLGFVDDLECVLDRKTGVIHVRSAARLGRRDFGVNRARIEKLRAGMASPA
ncbi:MAG: DUF1499 domain-containing protein [Betaproteobacteria bacterium]